MPRSPLTGHLASLEPRSVPAARPGAEGGARDSTRRARTAALAQAALQAFLERGVEGVTIDEIAAAAGVSKGSFYTYFASKLDLVEALVLPVASACVGALDECEAALTLARTPDELRTAYLGLANALTRVVTEHAGVALLYLQEARAPAVGAREPLCKLSADLRRRAVALTHAARSHGLVRSLDPHVTALAVVSAAEGLLFEALAGGELGSPHEVTTTLVDLALGGVATR